MLSYKAIVMLSSNRFIFFRDDEVLFVSSESPAEGRGNFCFVTSVLA